MLIRKFSNWKINIFVLIVLILVLITVLLFSKTECDECKSNRNEYSVLDVINSSIDFAKSGYYAEYYVYGRVSIGSYTINVSGRLEYYRYVKPGVILLFGEVTEECIYFNLRLYDDYGNLVFSQVVAI